MGKKKKDKVKPQLLKGFRDLMPRDMIAWEQMLKTIRDCFELRGFLPFRTATIETAETLLGPHYNEDSLAELFGFCGPDDVNMSLRYEFTLSLARFVAATPDLPLPFRGYQYGPVWRVDKPGPGRYREFTQCDIDIVGTSNLLADAEIIATMVSTFEDLGINNFVVRYAHRKILNGLIQHAGISDEQGPDTMRVIDKLEKQGRKAVIDELGPGRVDQSGDKIKGLGLESNQISTIEEFLDIASDNSINPIPLVEKMLDGNKTACEGIEDIRQIQAHLKGMGTDPTKLKHDLYSGNRTANPCCFVHDPDRRKVITNVVGWNPCFAYMSVIQTKGRTL